MKCCFSLLIALASLHLVIGQLQADSDCTDPCTCDKQTLSGKLKYPVEIEATDPSNGQQYGYTFSPCPADVKCGNGTTENVVICQFDPSNGDFIVIGKSTSVSWTINQTDPDHFTVTYGDGDMTFDNKVRKGTLSVTVSSQSPSSFKSNGENTLDTEIDYIFEAVIAPGAPSSAEAPVGIAGLLIIVLLFLALVAYFVIGGIVMYTMKGARGLEVIPNVSFWKDFPFLIKDGVLFTLSPCLRQIRGKSTYDSIS